MINFKESLRSLMRGLLQDQNFDCLSVGVINFESHNYFCVEEIDDKNCEKDKKIYYDLASLTKPLTLGSFYCQKPDLFKKNKQWELLLNHKGGLPSWGRLDKKSWKQQIMSYMVQPSKTRYSDFSALRLMLEIEKSLNVKFENDLLDFWDEEILFWKNLTQKNYYPRVGHRNGGYIRGVVHDDNAFVIDEFCTHAGIFGTMQGLCRTLINLEKKFSLLEQMKGAFEKYQNDNRFLNGWDTVDLGNGKESLAGKGCGPFTFGHLGFTGTSIWIDSKKSVGLIILTNATRDFWYERESLNHLRKEIGHFVWARPNLLLNN
jgi:CubicO group peptidase (beta-lactamase class C family)